MSRGAETCPCCGYKTLSQAAPGDYEICDVCLWEDDPLQRANPDYSGGANQPSLRDAQRNFAILGVSDRRFLDHRRPAASEFIKDTVWLPVEPLPNANVNEPLVVPNTHDLLAIAYYAVRFGLVPPQAVTRWADSVIEANQKPALWVIDLALSPPHAVEDQLRPITRPNDCEAIEKPLLGLICEHWRKGSLPAGVVRNMLYRTFQYEPPFNDARHISQIALEIELEFDCFDEGWGSEEIINKTITDQLAPFAVYAKLLPSWLRLAFSAA